MSRMMLRMQESLADFTRAIELDPSNASSYNSRGEATPIHCFTKSVAASSLCLRRCGSVCSLSLSPTLLTQAQDHSDSGPQSALTLPACHSVPL